MIRAILIPLLAIVGAVFAAYTVVAGSKPPPAQPPIVQPALPSFASFVAGSGMIEASSENIGVGTDVAGIVVEVSAKVGNPVKVGDVLFRIDARQAEAQAASMEAALHVALAEVERLERGTRPEILRMARARLDQAKSQLGEAQTQLELVERVSDARALSQDDLTRRRFAVDLASSRLNEAQEDLARLEAGTWEPDLLVARAQAEQARLALEAARVELERRVIRAPIDATVLQVNIRAGEYASAGGAGLVMVGALTPLHVRVDIDEHDAWRVAPGSEAEAFVRGHPEQHYALTFVRFEPMIVPKRSLTGESTERVDTRVLQILYRFDPGRDRVYVGQQVDAFIKAPALLDVPEEKTP